MSDPDPRDDTAGEGVEGDVDGADGAEAVEEAGPDLAHDLLARTRGGHLPPGARRRRPSDAPESQRDGWSGARPDRLDPTPVGAVLDGFVAARGWDQTMAQARVLSDWAAIVGIDVAGHCSPVSLTDGDLRLAAVSTAWATQLRMLEATMLDRIAERVGRGVVRRISVTGPVAPSWRHGPRSVQGSRGPRDTYG